MQMAEGDTCPHCGKDIHYNGKPMHLPAGFVVHGAHPYVIGAALGQGGFGITYIALDMVTGNRVAIKEFFPTFCSGRSAGSSVTPYDSQEQTFEKGRVRFLEEARVLKSLSDLKNIVNVLDLFQENNSAYLVMEYLDGRSLKEHVIKNGKFPAQEFLRQIRPLMEDIHRMHQRGVVHRDIAPDNIILLPDGQMKLIDFGAARSFFGDRSMTVVVKKGFAPVEQYLTKGSTAATDVYALAASIYYCITGTVPLDSAERQYDNLPLQAPTTLGAALTPTQEKALGHALEIQQKTRTQSVQEFLDQLAAKEILPEKPADSLPPEKPADSLSPEKPADSLPPEKSADSLPEKPADPDSGSATATKFPKVSTVIAALLVVLAGFLLFSGIFGSSTAAEPPTPPHNPNPEVSGPIAHPQGNAADRITEDVTLNLVATAYGSNSASWWRTFEKDFEKQYPRVDLIVDVLSWGDLSSTVDTRISRGNHPDILNTDQLDVYLANNRLLPVQTYMTEETYRKFYPQFLDHYARNGVVWAVPDLASVHAFYYNRDIFDSLGLVAPTSWDDVENACSAIRKNYPDVYPLGLDMSAEEGHMTFGCYSLGNGGGFTDSTGAWNLNAAENVEALLYLNSLVKAGFTNPDPSRDSRYALQNLFAEGKVAMMVAPNSMKYVCRSANSSVAQGIAPIPASDGKSTGTLAATSQFLCFDNNHSQSELAAITCFFDFFYEEQRYAAWTALEGFLPVTSDSVRQYEKNVLEYAWHDIIASASFLPTEKENWITAKQGCIDAMQRMLLGQNPQSLLDRLQQDYLN